MQTHREKVSALCIGLNCIVDAFNGDTRSRYHRVSHLFNVLSFFFTKRQPHARANT
jgi:hypothetical protein